MLKPAILFSLLILFVVAQNNRERFFNNLIQWNSQNADSRKTECSREFFQSIQCVIPHMDFFDIVMTSVESNGTEIIYNTGLMRKAVLVSNNISECIGHAPSCQFPKQARFFLDSFVYAGLKIYGFAFHCFKNANTIEVAQNCTRVFESSRGKIEDKHENFLAGRINFENKIKPMVQCVAQELYKTPSCTVDRIVDLYQAGRAILDVIYANHRFEKKLDVDWNFSSDHYC